MTQLQPGTFRPLTDWANGSRQYLVRYHVPNGGGYEVTTLRTRESIGGWYWWQEVYSSAFPSEAEAQSAADAWFAEVWKPAPAGDLCLACLRACGCEP